MIVCGVQRHCHLLGLSTVSIQALEKQVQQAGDMQQQLQLLQAESQQLTITEQELEVAEDRVCTDAEHCLMYIASTNEMLQGSNTMTLLVMLTLGAVLTAPCDQLVWYAQLYDAFTACPVLPKDVNTACMYCIRHHL